MRMRQHNPANPQILYVGRKALGIVAGIHQQRIALTPRVGDPRIGLERTTH